MKLFTRIAASIFLAGAAATAQAQNMSIATGGTGGVYYPLGGGMAAVLSKYVAGHAGHRRSHRRLGRQPEADRHGKPYIAFTMADAALDATRARTSSRARRSRCAR